MALSRTLPVACVVGRRAAGLHEAQLTSSVWTYADDSTCRWWGESQAERCTGPTFAAQAAEQGVGADQLARIADGWRAWGVDPDAWFAILHGEVLARVT